MMEPPGQLVLLPSELAKGSAISQQQYQQLELGQALQVSGGQVKLCDVRVCVEYALNLDLPTLGEGESCREGVDGWRPHDTGRGCAEFS